MASPGQDTISLYGQTFQQILTKVLGGSSNRFQLVYPFMDWTWPIPSPGYIAVKVYNVFGQMPAYSAIGSAAYSGSGTDLYTAYRNMLMTCPKLVESDAHRQQLKDIQDQINTAQTQQANDISARKTAWTLANSDIPAGMPPPEFDEWDISSGWQQRLETDTATMNKALQTKLAIVAQQNPAYKTALEVSEKPPKMTDVKAGFRKCQVTGQDSWRANFIVSDGQDWMAQLSKGGGNSLTIELNASESSSALKESWAGGAADYGSSFFGIYASGSWHDMDLTTSDKSVKVSIEITAVTQVQVRPDEWYDAGYLKTLQRLNQWNQPFNNDKVFGKNGLLPLLITGFVAGYKIKFTITMSSATYHRHVTDFKASGGIRIGPFHIGGGYHSHTDKWNKSTDNQSFSGGSEAEYPFIIGFTLAQPGYD